MLSLTTHLISCIRFVRVYIYSIYEYEGITCSISIYIILYAYFSFLRFESNK